MKDVGINLLRSQSVLSTTELMLLEKIKIVVIAVLVCTLASGVFAGVAYVAAQLRMNAIENERSVLLRRISLQARKEALLLSLKDRVPSLEKTVNSQYDWKVILGAVSRIAQPPQLKSLSIDEKDTLTLGLTVDSLEEIEQMTNAVKVLARDKQIKDPVIESLQTVESNKIELNIRFIPIFSYE